MLKTLSDITHHPLFNVVIGILVFAFIGAALVTIFAVDSNEQFHDLGDAVWWVLVTMTTVG